MSIETLLGHLDAVRQRGPGQYIARCPAHDDRSPSLSIKLCDDGRILMHCFAGCDVEAICDSLGLTLADLMPDSPQGHRLRRLRSTMPAREALQILDHEALVVALIANDFHKYREIDTATLQRLTQAVERMSRVRNAVAPARYRR